jgi:hypothetical protein
VLLVTADGINAQLTDEIQIANESAIKLRGTVLTPQSDAVIKRYLEAPCDRLAEAPRDTESAASQEVLEQLQNLAIAIRTAGSRARRLNAFILGIERQPTREWWALKDTTERTKLRNEFELNPGLINPTAEFLCKVGTWQEVRGFATNVQKTYAAAYGGIVTNGLPILYALLGAYAYRLRLFAETVRTRTYHPSFSDSARLITAIIAGAVAAIFKPIGNLSGSPLAVAFLLGYGVEFFFKFLDSILGALGSNTPSGRGDAEAQRAPEPRRDG